MTGSEPAYRPTLPRDEAERLRAWHEEAYQSMAARTGPTEVECGGRTFTVHPLAFPPVGELMARAVLDETTPADRVLDMGTGTGVNAILPPRSPPMSSRWTSTRTPWHARPTTPRPTGSRNGSTSCTATSSTSSPAGST